VKGKKILIANRGEIAIRVAKAAKELGLIPVGFWTDNEPNAPHLEYCEQWIHLPGLTNKETYLDQNKILNLVKLHKIDAVHPGYGFLSENTTFAKLLEENGVVWVGPNAKAINLMGDKAISKTIAKEAGVPVVPGSTGEVATVQEAIKIAQSIGYPVLLKAVAGGGGKGMRTCANDEEVRKLFETVQREALSSFGNGGLLVEKFIVNPHHIEVQIIADRKGNIFHVFERECSVQRRHQKIIEEAPPLIDPEILDNMEKDAVRLAKMVGYVSAGTVEYLYNPENCSYCFLELNPRLQVEHPCTEMITDVNLPACQLQIAMGLSLHRIKDIRVFYGESNIWELE